MFICGSASFGQQDEDDDIKGHYPNPKRTRRSISFGKILLGRENHNKNPYAERGLDKFYALLAELDDKKQKIYTEMGSEDIAFVHFVYSHNSDHVKPIVVKVRDKKQEKSQALDKSLLKVITSHEDKRSKEGSSEGVSKKTKKEKRSLRNSWGFKVVENLRKPYYYIPIFVILVLLFLAIYGRAFAILCTSIGLYVVPTVFQGSSSSSSTEGRKLKRKKEFVRKQSDKKISISELGPSSPKSVNQWDIILKK